MIACGFDFYVRPPLRYSMLYGTPIGTSNLVGAEKGGFDAAFRCTSHVKLIILLSFSTLLRVIPDSLFIYVTSDALKSFVACHIDALLRFPSLSWHSKIYKA